jgi:KipI family sensor histidine kinase inhibitor
VIRPFGEAALLVEVMEADAARRAAKIASIAAAAEEDRHVVAVVPGLSSLLVRYDPDQTDGSALSDRLHALVGGPPPVAVAGRARSIPVRYDGADLAETARLVGIEVDEYVGRHASLELTVLFLGFAPGFPYLGELPADLEVSRLATPRTSTPAGSVAVAGRLTGVYTTDSPGGWRVIGRTPIRLFDPDREPPAYLAPGDRVRFRAVSADELSRLDPMPADW